MTLPEKFKFVVDGGNDYEVYEAVVHGNEVAVSWNWKRMVGSASSGATSYTVSSALRFVENGSWKIVPENDQNSAEPPPVDEMMAFCAETGASIELTGGEYHVWFIEPYHCKTLEELTEVMTAVRVLHKVRSGK